MLAQFPPVFALVMQCHFVSVALLETYLWRWAEGMYLGLESASTLILPTLYQPGHFYITIIFICIVTAPCSPGHRSGTPC